MQEQILNRKQMYKLVWSEPISQICKKYLISEIRLRRTCIQMEVPMPTTEHWINGRLNKKLDARKLSENYDGESEVTLKLRPGSFSRSFNSPVMSLQREIEKKFKKSILVPKKLNSPDPLIIAAKNTLEERKTYYSNGLINTNLDMLDIQVGPNSVNRALIFMDCLVKLFKLRGYEISFEERVCYMKIDGERVKITCKEKCKRVKNLETRWDSYDLMPNGLLCFQAKIGTRSYEWVDGKEKLEKQVSNIIAKIEIGIQEHKGHMKRWAIIEEEARKKRIIEQEVEIKKSREKQKFAKIVEDANEWQQVMVVKNYLNKIEEEAINANRLDDKLIEWLTWAKSKLDSFNPIKNLWLIEDGKESNDDDQKYFVG